MSDTEWDLAYERSIKDAIRRNVARWTRATQGPPGDPPECHEPVDYESIHEIHCGDCDELLTPSGKCQSCDGTV